MANKPKNPNWKEDLEFFLNKGMNLTVACKHARVTTVTARNHGYGEPRRHLRDYHEQIKELREKGLTYAKIAEEVNFDPNSIYRHCKLWEIKKGERNG